VTPFHNTADVFGVPQLVPAHKIIEHEQKKYQKGILKNKHLVQFRQQMATAAAAAQKEQQRIPPQLLKADLEPFGSETLERTRSTKYAIIHSS